MNNLKVDSVQETENYMIVGVSFLEKKFFSKMWVNREITIEVDKSEEPATNKQLETSWSFNDNFLTVPNEMRKSILAKIELFQAPQNV